MEKKTVETDSDKIALAFTEWERRWRENPEKFQSDSERLAGTSSEYGCSVTPYFIEILESLE